MKKLFLVFIFILGNIIFSTEIIKNYDVDITVNKNGIIDVIESFDYFTDLDYKHGIIRKIPIITDGSYLKLEDKMGFILDQITLNDKKVKYSLDDKSSLLNIKIGSKSIFLQPNVIYNYKIKYKLSNVLRTKDNITQFYINAIGQYWDFPIEKYNINIRNFDSKEISVTTGSYGQTKDNYIINNNGVINIINKDILENNEGVTILINKNDFNFSKMDILYNKYLAYKPFFFNLVIFCIAFIAFVMSIYLAFKNKIRVNTPEYSTIYDPLLCYLVTNVYSYPEEKVLIYIFKLLKQGFVIYNEDTKKYELTDEGNNVISNLRDPKDVFAKRNYSTLLEIAGKEFNEYQKFYNENAKVSYLIIVPILTIIASSISLMVYSDIIHFTYVLMFALVVLVSSISIILVIIFKNYNLKLYNIVTKIYGYKLFLSKTTTKELQFFKDAESTIKYYKSILCYVIAFNLENQYCVLMENYLSQFQDGLKSFSGLGLYDIYYARQLLQSNQRYFNSTNSSSSRFSRGSGSFSSGSGFSGGGFSGGGGSSW